jgi:hypothetical protein
MIITFSRQELENINFIFKKNSQALDPQYIKKRNQYWKQLQNDSKKEKRYVWNGEIYKHKNITKNEFNNNLLELWTCEYKDIAFRNHYGRDKMINDFGSKNLKKYITVDCIPVTKDDSMVFGIRDSKTAVRQGSIGLVGGTLNKDEMKITGFEDLKKFAQKEATEELKLKTNLNQYKLICLNQFAGKYEFIFQIKLTINASEIKSLSSIEEFDELITLSKQEYLSYQGKKLLAFKYVKNYLNLLDV